MQADAAKDHGRIVMESCSDHALASSQTFCQSACGEDEAHRLHRMAMAFRNRPTTDLAEPHARFTGACHAHLDGVAEPASERRTLGQCGVPDPEIVKTGCRAFVQKAQTRNHTSTGIE